MAIGDYVLTNFSTDWLKILGLWFPVISSIPPLAKKLVSEDPDPNYPGLHIMSPSNKSRTCANIRLT